MRASIYSLQKVIWCTGHLVEAFRPWCRVVLQNKKSKQEKQGKDGKTQKEKNVGYVRSHKKRAGGSTHKHTQATHNTHTMHTMHTMHTTHTTHTHTTHLKECVVEKVIQLQDSTLVATAITVVGGTEDGHHMPLVAPVVTLHHKLMCSRNQRQPVGVVELCGNVWPKVVSRATWRRVPASSVIWIRPQQVTH